MASAKKPAKKSKPKRPAAKKPAAKKAAKKQPVAKKAAKKSAAKKPVAKKPVAKKPAKVAKPSRTEAEQEALAKATHALMDKTWSSFGTLEPDVISHVINPLFMGGPRWPGMRQAYRVAHAGKRVLIASDGLSDPFDPGEGPENVNGCGVEVFAITDDEIARDDAAGVARYGATWLHDLVFQTAQLVANHGRFAELFEKFGSLSSELYDVKIPEAHAARFVNAHGRVGIMITAGFSPLPAHVDGPLGPIKLLHVTLLTLEELASIVDDGQGVDNARNALAAKLAGSISQLGRASVV